MVYLELKRVILVENVNGEQIHVRTVADALTWIDRHAADEPGRTRTRRILSDAASERSLRKIRAATRAFEEAVRKHATSGKTG